LEDNSKGTESIIEELLIDFWIKVTDEDVGTHIQVFIVR